jgi:hypothetical protein
MIMLNANTCIKNIHTLTSKIRMYFCSYSTYHLTLTVKIWIITIYVIHRLYFRPQARQIKEGLLYSTPYVIMRNMSLELYLIMSCTASSSSLV